MVAHDVLPGLTAQDAPSLRVSNWLRGEGKLSQFAIYNDFGRLGTIWTEYRVDERSTQRFDLIWIDGSGLEIFPLRMSIASIFTEDGALDDLTVRLDSRRGEIRLHGERFPSDFSFTMEAGETGKLRRFKIPLAQGDIISGAFNPFANMENVHVGQSWRMQVFNPVAVLTGLGSRFIPMLVTVTGKEKIVTDAGIIDCLVVETGHAKAWVDARGAVQVQEMSIPVIGKLRVVRESVYDAEARHAARRASLEPGTGGAP